MMNEENESANIKASNPLTPQQDNSAFRSVPVRPAPWSAKSEAGSAMNKERALNMFRTANQWLYDKLAEGALCSCGNCYLCAYNFFAAAQPATTPSASDYEEVLADHRRLVQELDQLLNGENAAERASLVDIVAQLRARTTPSDITERARRAVYALGPMIELADLSDEEIERAVAIIAAEFGEGEKS